jgi:pimeloyl-ACP methyl ester carboxylesterase
MPGFHSRRLDVKGLDIHYLTGGQGEPLIIVHGGSGGARAWKKNIAELSKKYTIYVPDLPGFGSSQSMAAPYYITEMVDFIDDFANALELSSFYLMGHSFGGGIALQYTLSHPAKIRKLVLVSSLCLGREIAWWIRWFSGPFVGQTAGKLFLSVFKAVKYIARFFGPWEVVGPITKASIHIGSCMASLTEQTIVLLGQLPQIMVPTLVMWGSKDPIVPFSQAYSAAELIPDCQVRVFENCGHSVYRDRLPEFSSVLSGFLG